MEAKDTVMGMQQIARFEDYPFSWIVPMLEAQAEISFKAGVDRGWEQAEAHYHIDTG